jgi:ATP-dependent Lhr-like helicase
VLADVELELQCLADGRRARDADELHDVLRKVGDLTAAEVDLRCEGDAGDAASSGSPSWCTNAERSRWAVAGEMRVIAAAEDAARYRDALGCAIPLGLPRAFTEPVPLPLESLVARYARTHAPVPRRRPRPPLRGVPVDPGRPVRWPRSRPTSGWCAASSGPTA